MRRHLDLDGRDRELACVQLCALLVRFAEATDDLHACNVIEPQRARCGAARRARAARRPGSRGRAWWPAPIGEG
jgi:hypothetical protein